MKIIILVISLIFTTTCFAQDIRMPKEQWLLNLEKIMIVQMCRPASPFLEIYKGNDCKKDIKALYRKCIKDVDNVKIPKFIKSVPQANRLGQILAECVSAHYAGGHALKAFNLLQSLESDKK